MTEGRRAHPLDPQRVDRLFELAGLEGNDSERERLPDDVARILESWSVLRSSEDSGDEFSADVETRLDPDRVDRTVSISLPHRRENRCDASDYDGRDGLVHAYHEAGKAGGPLSGLRYATKANIAVRGRPHDCCSRILAGYLAPYDATVTTRLGEAGATLVGATNMDEFAMGSSTLHSAYGPTRHPFDESLSVGGSSGGAAALVASGVVPFALGSDTGGSVRQPAACCGVWGLRPTWGRVSRFGLTAFASSLDQIGVLAADLEVLSRVFEVIAGFDPRDATTHRPRKVVPRPGGGQPWRLAVDETLSGLAEAEARTEFEESVLRLERAGLCVTRIRSRATAHALETYHVLSSVEAASNLARFDGSLYGRQLGGSDYARSVRATRSAGFGSEVKRRILMGVLAATDREGDAHLSRARSMRSRIRDDHLRTLEEHDAILTPGLPTATAPSAADPASATSELQRDRMTAPASLAGLPALVLPVSRASASPGSLQLVGGVDAEARLFELARDCREALA